MQIPGPLRRAQSSQPARFKTWEVLNSLERRVAPIACNRCGEAARASRNETASLVAPRHRLQATGATQESEENAQISRVRLDAPLLGAVRQDAPYTRDGSGEASHLSSQRGGGGA
jgi:hypothetical protein